MTGVERFAKMMEAAEFALAIIEDPKDRATGVAQVMAANAISLAAELIRDHDYGGAHDVILTADAVITALLNDHLNDPRYAKSAAGMLARVNGHDVPLSAMVDLEFSEPAPPSETSGGRMTMAEIDALTTED